jgi:hypothetical protein
MALFRHHLNASSASPINGIAVILPSNIFLGLLSKGTHEMRVGRVGARFECVQIPLCRLLLSLQNCGKAKRG